MAMIPRSSPPGVSTKVTPPTSAGVVKGSVMIPANTDRTHVKVERVTTGDLAGAVKWINGGLHTPHGNRSGK